MNTEEQKTAPVEIEGGGWYWVDVCGECHGIVRTNDKICPHCKCILIWEGETE